MTTISLRKIETVPNMECYDEGCQHHENYRGHVIAAAFRDGKWESLVWSAKGQRIWPGVKSQTQQRAIEVGREHIDSLLGAEFPATRAAFGVDGCCDDEAGAAMEGDRWDSQD